jgi:hypothetical protein
MVTLAVVLRQSGDKVYLTSHAGLLLGNEHITNLHHLPSAQHASVALLLSRVTTGLIQFHHGKGRDYQWFCFFVSSVGSKGTVLYVPLGGSIWGTTNTDAAIYSTWHYVFHRDSGSRGSQVWHCVLYAEGIRGNFGSYFG